MADYPQNVVEFRDWFATESACREYLAQLRWAPGSVLPRLRQHCGVAHEDTVLPTHGTSGGFGARTRSGPDRGASAEAHRYK